MALFMTSEQLAELTDSRRRDLQIKWLEVHGWEFEVSRLGNPKVLIAYLEKRMGVTSAGVGKHSEPDFSRWLES